MNTYEVTREEAGGKYKEHFLCNSKQAAMRAFLDYVECDTVEQAEEEGIHIESILKVIISDRI